MGSRAWAGVLPGFFLTGMVVSWLCWGMPGPWTASVVAPMLLFFPLWVTVICVCLIASSAFRAWLLTAGPAVAGLAMLWWCQGTGWVQ